MDFNKAIRILALTSNFTEEELRKAYRRLISKYHPDKYVSKSEKERKEAEEKAKEINTAKEFLENYKKENNRNSKQNSNTYKPNDAVEVLLRKEQFKITLNYMKEELASIISFVKLVNDLKIIKETINDISYLIKTVENQMNLIYTLEAVRIQERTYFNRLSSILEKFEKEYCKKYNITLTNKKLARYSLKKLYEELEQLKKEQNGYSIEELLDNELNKYVYYSGYTVIKKLIQNIIEDFISSYSNTKEEKEKIINRFNKKVLQEFKEYYKRLEVLNEFKQMNLKGANFKKLLTSLEDNIANPKLFKYYETELVNALADTLSRDLTPNPVRETKNYNIKYINNNICKEEYIKKDYNITTDYPKKRIKKIY